MNTWWARLLSRPNRPAPLPVPEVSLAAQFYKRELDDFFGSRVWQYIRALAIDDLENIRVQLEVAPEERRRWADTEFQTDDQLRGAAKALRQYVFEWPNDLRARVSEEEQRDE